MSNLKKWITRLSQEEMPIFGATVQAVVNVSEDDSANLADLAQVILQDTSMTARVLKLVNTIYYNPSSKPISTVSRAIQLIGFDTVRSICLSIALIDTLVKDGNRRVVLQEMARSIHAAVQARNIAIERGDPCPEETFVAALLYHLGHMAFWCFSDTEGDGLLTALDDHPDAPPEMLEKKELGFTLREITLGLSESWRLNNLLIDTLDAKKAPGIQSKIILLSHRLAEAAEKGWNNPNVKEVMEEIAKLLSQPIETVTALLHDGAKDSAHIASKYGAATVAKIIPLPKPYSNTLELENAVNMAASPYPQPDVMLQLNVLREVKELLMTGRPSFNVLLEMLLEGIYRGVGMDNTLIALCTNERKTLGAKFALGSEREELMTHFNFKLNPQVPNIFMYTLDRRQPVWVTRQLRQEQPQLFSRQIEQVLGTGPFLIAPLIVNGQPAGIIYADRVSSGRNLDDDCFNGFKLFTTEASMAVSLLAQSRSQH